MSRRIFKPGERVGWLTLVRESVNEEPTRGSSGRFWSCRCKCRAIHRVSRESLISGRVASCRPCSKAFRAEEREMSS